MRMHEIKILFNFVPNPRKISPFDKKLFFLALALNPTYGILLNFAKSCLLTCLSNVDNIKKFHRAVFEL